MSAGQPNWQKLAEMGKLPKEQFNKVQFYNLVCDDCKKKIFNESKKASEPKVEFDSEESLSKTKIDENVSTIFTAKCDKCDFVAEGNMQGKVDNKLRLHQRAHKN